MSRIIKRYTNEEGKNIEVRRRIIPFQFDVSERKTKQNIRFKIPSSVKRITKCQVIPHNLATPLKASKRYWALNSNPVVITANSTDIDIKNYIESTASSEDLVSKTASIQMVEVLPNLIEKPIYATPVQFGIAQVLVNGAQGLFSAPKIVSITDPETAYTEDYYVYFALSPLNASRINLSVI